MNTNNEDLCQFTSVFEEENHESQENHGSQEHHESCRCTECLDNSDLLLDLESNFNTLPDSSSPNTPLTPPSSEEDSLTNEDWKTLNEFIAQEFPEEANSQGKVTPAQTENRAADMENEADSENFDKLLEELELHFEQSSSASEDTTQNGLYGLEYYRRRNHFRLSDMPRGEVYQYEISPKANKSRYEPQILRRKGAKRSSTEGLCPYCEHINFLKLSSSAYLHHLGMNHGIFSNGEKVKEPTFEERQELSSCGKIKTIAGFRLEETATNLLKKCNYNILIQRSRKL
ncbi:hypothetical protein PACTADRAFT_1074 [Pachysolen tannophilus NRRL Y-2460]|uniref:Transcription regulator Rua1 C-terminal domain-containing protein n=1 Tax=Pachysolen tannophilus NRRL Y-2460 TaxID=669874 RepID=A0A1E4U3W9_PACTA|nr:hypothetical protein PACTADRAFT_1074 [Pachysolen tannophilus NRRL Y-2460]